jgi:frataxin-like iron-binding protein CyaY
MFVEIAEVYLATLGHTLDDSAEKDVDNSGDVLTLGVKFFRPATAKKKL